MPVFISVDCVDDSYPGVLDHSGSLKCLSPLHSNVSGGMVLSGPALSCSLSGYSYSLDNREMELKRFSPAGSWRFDHVTGRSIFAPAPGTRLRRIIAAHVTYAQTVTAWHVWGWMKTTTLWDRHSKGMRLNEDNHSLRYSQSGLQRHHAGEGPGNESSTLK